MSRSGSDSGSGPNQSRSSSASGSGPNQSRSGSGSGSGPTPSRSSERVPRATPRPRSSRDGAGAGRAPAGPAGRRPARTQRRGEGQDTAARLAATFARLFLEVESGRRAAVQLSGLMCPRLYAQLAPLWVRPGPQGRIQRFHGRRVSAERYEATAVIDRAGRRGALALCLTRAGGAWRVTAAARPEDGPLPEPRWAVPDHEPDAFDLVCVDVGATGPRAAVPVP